MSLVWLPWPTSLLPSAGSASPESTAHVQWWGVAIVMAVWPLSCIQTLKPKPELQSEGGGAGERLSSRELGPDDWDGRRIRRPLQRASVEARRRSSFKGDNEAKTADAGALQLEGGQGNSRRPSAVPINGDGAAGGLPAQCVSNGGGGGSVSGSGGGSTGGGGSTTDHGAAGGGAAEDRAIGDGGKT